MFLRRQDVIDKFDTNFRSDENGQMYYWPKRSDVGLPITFEEYDQVTQAFERKHFFGMLKMWGIAAVCTLIAFYQLFVHDSFKGAMLAFLGMFVISTAMMTRDQLGLLLPFGQRLRELKKSMEKAGVTPQAR